MERLGWDEETLVDWSGCELVERVPGRCSGAPTIVGTRIRPDIIQGNFEAGSPLEEIAENYPSVSMETIKALIAFAQAQRMQSVA
jgi:uncharacterized protein (DUF433 family)